MRNLIIALFFVLVTACYPKFKDLETITDLQQIEFEDTWWEVDNMLLPLNSCVYLSTFDNWLYITYLEDQRSFRMTQWAGDKGVYEFPEYNVKIFVYFSPKDGYTILAESGILTVTSRIYTCEIDYL